MGILMEYDPTTGTVRLIDRGLPQGESAIRAAAGLAGSDVALDAGAASFAAAGEPSRARPMAAEPVPGTSSGGAAMDAGAFRGSAPEESRPLEAAGAGQPARGPAAEGEARGAGAPRGMPSLEGLPSEIRTQLTGAVSSDVWGSGATPILVDDFGEPPRGGGKDA